MQTLTKNSNNEWVEGTPADGEPVKYVHPDGHSLESIYQVEVLSVSIRKITIGSFRRRFTLTEKVAIEVSTDPVVRVLDKDLMTSSFVDLDHPDVVQGIQYLADTANIIALDRVDVILQDGTVEEL